MTIRLLMGMLAFSAAAVCAPPAGGVETNIVDGVAAVVNDRQILRSDVNRAAVGAYRRLIRQYSGDELKARTVEAYGEALDQLINEQVILLSFPEAKLAAVDSMVDDRMEDMIGRQFNGDRSAFLQALSEERIPLSKWRQDVGERLLVGMLIRREVESKVAVSPGAVRGRYESNPSKYRVPERVKLRMIAIGKGADEASAKAARERAATVLKKLNDGGDFAELAAEYSQDAKAAKGGEWGWVESDSLRPEIRAAVSNLNARARCGPVETSGDLYIIEMINRQPASTAAFEDVCEEIKGELSEELFARLYDSWIDRLKKRLFVKVYE